MLVIMTFHFIYLARDNLFKVIDKKRKRSLFFAFQLKDKKNPHNV